MRLYDEICDEDRLGVGVEVDFSGKNIYHKSVKVQARGKNFTSETYLCEEKLLLRDFANQKGRV
jgi:hypothetical protein